MIRAQYGKVKEDCLQANKRKTGHENCWVILIKSRFFVEKWEEASKFIRDGSLECVNSAKLAELRTKCDIELA